MLAALAVDPLKDLNVARPGVPLEQVVGINRESKIVHEGLGAPLDQMVVKPARLVPESLQPRRSFFRQLARVDLEREGFRPHRLAPLGRRLARGFSGLAVLVLDGFSGGLGHGAARAKARKERVAGLYGGPRRLASVSAVFSILFPILAPRFSPP